MELQKGRPPEAPIYICLGKPLKVSLKSAILDKIMTLDLIECMTVLKKFTLQLHTALLHSYEQEINILAHQVCVKVLS